MSNGPDYNESSIHDQLMGEEEMALHWKQISVLLHSRTLKARETHLRDPENMKKAQKYLKCSQEYYSFTRLVFLFRSLVQSIDDGLLDEAPSGQEMKKTDMN